MSEMAAFLKMGKLPLCVTQFPSGTWGFVGSVPVELRWIYDDLQDCRDAASFGEGLVEKIAKKKGRRFGTRTWPSREAALADAKALGHKVSA